MDYLYRNCKLAMAVLSLACIGLMGYVVLFMRSTLTLTETAMPCVTAVSLTALLVGCIYTLIYPKRFHVLSICTLLAIFPLVYSTVIAGRDMIIWFVSLGNSVAAASISIVSIVMRFFFFIFTVSTVCTVVFALMEYRKSAITFCVISCISALFTITGILIDIGSAASTAHQIIQGNYCAMFLLFSIANVACVARFFVPIEDTQIKKYAYDELGFAIEEE